MKGQRKRSQRSAHWCTLRCAVMIISHWKDLAMTQHLDTTILVYTPTSESPDHPSIRHSRHAVLAIHCRYGDGCVQVGYVVYDCLLSHIVDDVYFDEGQALDTADFFNARR